MTNGGIYSSSGSGALIPIQRCEALQGDDSSVPRSTAQDASDYTYGLGPMEQDFEIHEFTSPEQRMSCFGAGDIKLRGHTFSIKFPPGFSGQETWFTYEQEVLEWCKVTTAEATKRGALLRLGMHGTAIIWKEIFEEELLSDPNTGVTYFLETLRPKILRNALHVFLFRFKRFHNLIRGRTDFLDFVPRFEKYRRELLNAWLDTQKYPTEADARAWDHATDEARVDYVARGFTWPDAATASGREKIRQIIRTFLRAEKSKDFFYNDIILASQFLIKCELNESQMVVFNQQLRTKNLSYDDLTVDIISEILQESFSLNKNALDDPHIRGRKINWGKVTFLCADSEDCIEESYGYLDGVEGELG